MDAHYELCCLYMNGEGVEKDEKKVWYHLEEAAIAGHPFATHNLERHEGRKDRYDRAAKHWIIAAYLGCNKSIQMLKEYYKHGLVSKEDFAAALRGHQAAIDATKSPQREAAAKASVSSSQDARRRYSPAILRLIMVLSMEKSIIEPASTSRWMRIAFEVKNNISIRINKYSLHKMCIFSI